MKLKKIRPDLMTQVLVLDSIQVYLFNLISLLYFNNLLYNFINVEYIKNNYIIEAAIPKNLRLLQNKTEQTKDTLNISAAKCNGAIKETEKEIIKNLDNELQVVRKEMEQIKANINQSTAECDQGISGYYTRI